MTKTTIPHFYQQIQGWFNFEDIYRQAVRDSNDNAVFVEVGSWRGRSIAFLAVEIANSGKSIALHAVDTWKGSDEPFLIRAVREAGGTIFPEFMQNMHEGGVADFITPIRCESVEAAKRFADASIDFCFIDAAHDFRSVREDIRAWFPKVKEGGVIAGHDVDRIEVRAAVQDAIPWSRVEIRGSSWFHRKAKCPYAHWVRPLALKKDLPPHLILIPCVTNETFLERAVRSMKVPGANVGIVDTSENGLNLESQAFLDDSIGILRVNQRISFTQTMNLLQDEARASNSRFLVFMHADAAANDFKVLPELLTDMDARQRADRIGVMFTQYDALCAFAMTAVNDVGPWDETFDWYKSDFDYYHRMRLREWRTETNESLRSRVSHAGSISMKTDAEVRQRVKQHLVRRRRHFRHKWGRGNSIPYA